MEYKFVRKSKELIEETCDDGTITISSNKNIFSLNDVSTCLFKLLSFEKTDINDLFLKYFNELQEMFDDINEIYQILYTEYVDKLTKWNETGLIEMDLGEKQTVGDLKI